MGQDDMTQACRVVVVDDHVVTRAGIRIMAEMHDSNQVVGEGSTGEEAVRLCEELEPDVVLIDLDIPGMGGLDAINRIGREHPDVQVVVLTVSEDEDTILSAIRAGAAGYLSKSSSGSDIAQAIAAVRSGGTYMSPSVAGVAMRGWKRRSDERYPDSHEPLTARQKEVLVLLAQGLSARNMAGRLGISERTVNTHIGHCYRKLGVNNRVDAVLAGMRLGLVDVPA